MPNKKTSDDLIEDTEREYGPDPKKAGGDIAEERDGGKSAPPAEEQAPGRKPGEADAPMVPDNAKPSFE